MNEPYAVEFDQLATAGLLPERVYRACGSSKLPAPTSPIWARHGHRMLRVRGKGGKIFLVALAPAVGRAIERATYRSCIPRRGRQAPLAWPRNAGAS